MRMEQAPDGEYIEDPRSNASLLMPGGMGNSPSCNAITGWTSPRYFASGVSTTEDETVGMGMVSSAAAPSLSACRAASSSRGSGQGAQGSHWCTVLGQGEQGSQTCTGHLHAAAGACGGDEQVTEGASSGALRRWDRVTSKAPTRIPRANAASVTKRKPIHCAAGPSGNTRMTSHRLMRARIVAPIESNPLRSVVQWVVRRHGHV